MPASAFGHMLQSWKIVLFSILQCMRVLNMNNGIRIKKNKNYLSGRWWDNGGWSGALPSRWQCTYSFVSLVFKSTHNVLILFHLTIQFLQLVYLRRMDIERYMYKVFLLLLLFLPLMASFTWWCDVGFLSNTYKLVIKPEKKTV